MRFIIISLLSFTLFGCLSLAPELEWEDVTSDHDPVLRMHGRLRESRGEMMHASTMGIRWRFSPPVLSNSTMLNPLDWVSSYCCPVL